MKIGEITADNQVSIIDTKNLNLLKQRAMMNEKTIEERANAMYNETVKERGDNMIVDIATQEHRHWKFYLFCFMWAVITIPITIIFTACKLIQLIF